MQIDIRKGTKDDMQAVHDLIFELALYEKAPEEVTNTVEDMIRDGFSDTPIFHCLVATTNEKVIGMAIYFVKYSTWKGKGIYLDDIVVTESMRGNKVGERLLDAVIQHSYELNAQQLHWQVLDWNEPAIKFYKKYPTNFDSEWINCKLSRAEMFKHLNKTK